MRPSHAASKKPPKFAIANGLVIRSLPNQISYCSPDMQGESRSNDVTKDVNEVIKQLVAPIRPFGCIFQQFGSFQKHIQGYYQFFNTDQNCVWGKMNF